MNKRIIAGVVGAVIIITGASAYALSGNSSPQSEATNTSTEVTSVPSTDTSTTAEPQASPALDTTSDNTATQTPTTTEGTNAVQGTSDQTQEQSTPAPTVVSIAECVVVTIVSQQGNNTSATSEGYKTVSYSDGSKVVTDLGGLAGSYAECPNDTAPVSSP